MNKYKIMYKILFQAITKSINILKNAQREVEEIFISNDDDKYNANIISFFDIKNDTINNKD